MIGIVCRHARGAKALIAGQIIADIVPDVIAVVEKLCELDVFIERIVIVGYSLVVHSYTFLLGSLVARERVDVQFSISEIGQLDACATMS